MWDGSLDTTYGILICLDGKWAMVDAQGSVICKTIYNSYNEIINKVVNAQTD